MKLTFLGANLTVTGSSFLIEAQGGKVLVDCGMFQGSKVIEALNRRAFAYEPAGLDCVVLTHAHIDHSGLLPRLCKEGFKGPIYATKVTNELCGIMLPDSGHIQEIDAEMQNRKGKRAGKKTVQPLYTVDDAFQCLERFTSVPYKEKLEILPGITIRFQNAGHILGSAMAEIWVEEGQTVQKIVFSGDLGQPDQPIIRSPVFLDDADYVIMETTYGDRVHEPFDKEQTLADIVNQTIQKGGNVVIPAFAVGRTQTMLYYFIKLFKEGRIPDIPVIIDSPLAISATDIFRHNTQEYDKEAFLLVYDKGNPLHMPQLRFTRSSDESKAINTLTKPAIIISASGMADAGRILHHLKHNLWRPQSSVLLVGYQAEGSMGRRLMEGAKKVKIMGEEISVKASIYNLDGFSAHADRDFLFKWLSCFTRKPAQVFLVHGEPEMARHFAGRVENMLHLPAYIPHYGDSAVMAGRQWHLEATPVPHLVDADPQIQNLQNQLAQLEAEYAAYRSRLEDYMAANRIKPDDAARKLEKVTSLIRKNLDDLLKKE